MQEPRAQRTLVKSPPELWAELSDIDALARHLGEFGEIRITRLDPETTVAWEGDRACGTVALEPTAWGTKVTITAKLAEEVVVEPVAVVREPEPEPVAAEPEPVAVEPEPVAVEPEAEPATPEPEPPPTEAPKAGFFARLFGRRRQVEPVVEVDPEAEPVAVDPEPVPVTVEPEPEPVAIEPESVAAEPEPEPEPVAVQPEPEPQPAPLDVERAEAILTGVLDDLGSAHHRPFSRS
ncbi:MAG TPA: hypothetical protein VFY32_04540 [Solirubrobacteraceae bacterium]|nr:hypothetical protein [Solirubrobacteraceae bacterium]